MTRGRADVRWMLLLALLSLLSTEASARQRMSFTPGDRSRPAFHHGAGGRAARPVRYHGGRHGSRTSHSAAARHSGTSDDEGGEAARPGAGFKMEDGVLTYPAPERFQPRNLKHP